MQANCELVSKPLWNKRVVVAIHCCYYFGTNCIDIFWLELNCVFCFIFIMLL